MVQILVIYDSDYGSTKQIAEIILEGVESVNGSKGILKTAEEATEKDILESDGLIVGSPVHMGSPSWKIKKFIDTVCSKIWMEDHAIGKVGAVFTTGGGYGRAGGGCEVTMLALLSNLAELGMILVPLPKSTPGYAFGGHQWGPYSRSLGPHMEQTGISEDSFEVAKHHGANVARIAIATKGKELFH